MTGFLELRLTNGRGQILVNVDQIVSVETKGSVTHVSTIDGKTHLLNMTYAEVLRLIKATLDPQDVCGAPCPVDDPGLAPCDRLPGHREHHSNPSGIVW